VNVRVAVIGGEYRAAALVERPRLRGDGRTSFAAWVETLNTDPRRADWRACEVLVLDRVEPGDDDLALLELHGLGVDDPVPVGVDLELTGEESAVEDVTEELAAPWRRHAVEACRLLGVDVGGVDLRGPRAALADPASEPGLRILEVNVLPALHLHALPTSGAPRPVFEDFVAYCLQLPGAPAPGRGPAV
jgi:cyanophycin synthetase